MLLPRLITAIIGIPLVVFSIYWGGIPFFVLIAGVVFLSLREYFILAGMKYDSMPIVGTLMGLFLFASMFLNGTKIGAHVNNYGTSVVISIVFVIIFFAGMLRRRVDGAIERVGVTFLGAFFVPWSLGHLVLIRDIRTGGMYYILYLFILIWTLDTGAYAVGIRFGKRKLAKNISPKKTIEGAIGGSLTAILVSILMRTIFLKEFFSLKEIIIVGFIISILSQLSDLAESLLKRDVGVKDSAALLPGHGGILDRFDSFLFTAPLLYYYITIVKI